MFFFFSDDDKDKGLRDFDIHPNYGTMKFCYTADEFERFKSLVEYNVRDNIKKIDDSIQSVINLRSKMNVE